MNSEYRNPTRAGIVNTGMDLPSFSVTWDYRCPFARNAHDHLVTALRGGAAWDVSFVPFSLTQTHIEDGELSVWEDPSKHADLLALQAAVVVRDNFSEHFLDLHEALFKARHEQSKDVRDPEVVREALVEAGIADPSSIFDAISTGEPLAQVRKEHEQAVSEHDVFGVPTFISGDHAAFVRIMTRPQGDAATARHTIERIVNFVSSEVDLNEMKRTRLDR